MSYIDKQLQLYEKMALDDVKSNGGSQPAENEDVRIFEQTQTMLKSIFAYWCVGVPLAIYNTFYRYSGTTICGMIFNACGVRGLVIGMTTGTWVS